MSRAIGVNRSNRPKRSKSFLAPESAALRHGALDGKNSSHPTMSTAGDITVLLQRAESGDRAAAEALLARVYEELRRIAASRMKSESSAHTLQPTALVHEAWLRLGGDQQPAWNNRAHFFGAAAEAMRRILVDAARRKRTVRHGGADRRVDTLQAAQEAFTPEIGANVLALHEALDALAAHDARKAELVKLHFFAGLTLAEAADVLGVSEPTAKRDWAYARAWLFREIRA
jgi:RNA polymerase sigma factor (TIGR02999 family)